MSTIPVTAPFGGFTNARPVQVAQFTPTIAPITSASLPNARASVPIVKTASTSVRVHQSGNRSPSTGTVHVLVQSGSRAPSTGATTLKPSAAVRQASPATIAPALTHGAMRQAIPAASATRHVSPGTIAPTLTPGAVRQAKVISTSSPTPVSAYPTTAHTRVSPRYVQSNEVRQTRGVATATPKVLDRSAAVLDRSAYQNVNVNRYSAQSDEHPSAAGTTIMYTYTDEAPMLATHAFFPIIKAFCKHADIDVQLKDISVAGRVIANFPEYLKDDQKMNDVLADLGLLAQSGNANIIKLPNVSASVPQLKECIKELQGKGYALPDYPEDPKDDKEKAIKARYAKVLGSAVNPVLREGNSDRRAAVPVKQYAKQYPHSMGKWSPESRTSVVCMEDGDFYSHERSITIEEAVEARIELVGDDGSITILRPKLSLQANEVLDASFMDCELLCKFYEEAIQKAKSDGVLFSLHLKATMMKISDPIMFGHCVKVYFKDVFAKYSETFAKLGIDANNGLGDVYKKIAALPESEKSAIERDIMATYEKRGPMAIVNARRGITNLHVPSDVIIDNSMPTAIRGGGKMWDINDKEQDFVATIPDRGYGNVFKEVVDFCKENGAFDPKTMGGCPNVGLMAQKAEEYGSHPNTFEASKDGTIRIVVNGTNLVLLGHKVKKGDIYRACQTKDAPIKDWVKLGVARVRANNFPNNDKPCKGIFWLDSARPHDLILMDKVRTYLPEFDTTGLDIEIMSPVEAMRVTLQRAKQGLNTITITGNVLRDYLTDLFPILELGTSAKMLSIVPMLEGGAMYETGAGGSAPKHVEQFQQEGHLRWDSLGEYLALSCAFQDLAATNPKAKVMTGALDKAVGSFLLANKNPSRKVNEIDNRGSHYWLARYWAEELAKQKDDLSLQRAFEKTSIAFRENETKVLQELIECQGKAMDIGGYYKLDKAKADAAMNPSVTLNSIISSI